MSLFLPFRERNVSDATKRATRCGSLFAIFLILLFTLIKLGFPFDMPHSFSELLARRAQHVMDRGWWGMLVNPAILPVVLALVGGSILRFWIILLNVRCKAPSVTAMSNSSKVVAGRVIGAHLFRSRLMPHGFFLKVDPAPVGSASASTGEVLGALVRSMDLRSRHAALLPAHLAGWSSADTPASAGEKTPVDEYLEQYRNTCDGDRLDARKKWFENKDFNALLGGKKSPVVVSADRTILDLLSTLCQRFGSNALKEAGLLVATKEGLLEPNPLLLLDAPVFPSYDEKGEVVGLTHSLSPICGSPGSQGFHDLREIESAGAEDGTIVVTSGVHYSLFLREYGYHAMALHPHVWAHNHVAAGWPLPHQISSHWLFETPEIAPGRVEAERMCHLLAAAMAKYKIKRVIAGLSWGFPAIMGDETYAHRSMPNFLFRQFVRRYLAPALKEFGIAVQLQGFMASYLSSARFQLQYGSVQYILRRAGLDLDGEAALFNSAPLLVDEEHKWVTPRSVPTTVQNNSRPNPNEDEPEYSFRFGLDKHWTITYDSETCNIRDSYGIRYIVALLEHPNEETYAKDLIGSYGDKHAQWHGEWVVAGENINLSVGDESGIDARELRPDSQTSVGMSNKRKIEGLKKCLVEIEEEIKDSDDEEDTPPTNERSDRSRGDLIARKKRIEELIRQWSVSVDSSPQVKQVAKNLRDALKTIKSAGMEKLSQHLSETLPPLQTDRLSYKQRKVNFEPDWNLDWGPRPSALKRKC
jgi:hypothetical protein